MQTTKWGPPGWKFLHSIISEYPNDPTIDEKNIYKCFISHIANILPCIYCRISYRNFVNELSIVSWLKNKRRLTYYFYLIHNKVNDKLRQQGYLNDKNPSFSQIEQKYKRSKVYTDCGWDFIYAITYNYPINPSDCDKYNHKIFFTKLKYVMPYLPVKQLYQKYFCQYPVNNYLHNRQTLTLWFYNIHKRIIENLIHEGFLENNYYTLSYFETTTKYENFRASCQTNSFQTSNSCRLPSNNSISV